MEAILLVIGAALLYLLALPIFGLLIGLMIRVFLPYGVGVFMLYLFVYSFSDIGHVVWYTLGASILWVAIMLRSRSALQRYQEGLAWHEGHFSSMLHILTLSQLPRRNRVYSP